MLLFCVLFLLCWRLVVVGVDIYIMSLFYDDVVVVVVLVCVVAGYAIRIRVVISVCMYAGVDGVFGIDSVCVVGIAVVLRCYWC